MRNTLILSGIISIAAATLTSFIILNSKTHIAIGDSALNSGRFETIIESGEIRCGYVTYSPGLILDPNTGEISGIAAEVIERIADKVGLSVNWIEQVGWDTMIEGIKSNRYDAVCSAIYANTVRAQQVSFSTPMFYGGLAVYARSDDDRFNEDLLTINSPEITIATIDGEITDILARNRFPNSNTLSLPQLTDISQMLNNVVTGKADVTFAEPFTAKEFLENNPNTLQNVTPDKPLQIFPNVLLLPNDEPRLSILINAGIEEMQNSGELDQIVKKYAGEDSGFFGISLPYRSYD